MSYQDEDEFKSQFRDFTRETRKLRLELDAFVRAGEVKDLTRGLLHVTGKITLDPPTATDRPRRRRATKR